MAREADGAYFNLLTPSALPLPWAEHEQRYVVDFTYPSCRPLTMPFGAEGGRGGKGAESPYEKCLFQPAHIK